MLPCIQSWLLPAALMVREGDVNPLHGLGLQGGSVSVGFMVGGNMAPAPSALGLDRGRANQVCSEVEGCEPVRLIFIHVPVSS